MRPTTLLRKLLRLVDSVVRGVRIDPDGAPGVKIEVASRARRPRCGVCGRKAERLHGRYKERRWRDLGVFGRPTWLVAKIARVLCRHCGVKTMLVPWARRGSDFTRRFEDEVAWFIQHTDKTTTARYFRISWVTVGRIAARVVEEKLDRSKLKDLQFIGVDEISYGRPQKFLTVVVDHIAGRIVWAGEGKSAETLAGFFALLDPETRAGIEIVTKDMAESFDKAVRENVPNAEIVYDFWHVVRLLSDAIDEVRRAEVNATDPGDPSRKELKGLRWVLLKHDWNMTRLEQEKLSLLPRLNRRLYRAYLLRAAFREIFRARSLTEADRLFDEWWSWAVRAQLEPLRRFAYTVRRYWNGVRRYLELRLTNALAEGFNSKIRMISHRAFGFHSADALIAMLHLNCSGIEITPVGL